MKLTDVEEVRQIGEKLKAIKNMHLWLDSFSIRGCSLITNGLSEKIELPHSTSRSLLDEVEMDCIKRLRELGVET